MTALLVFSCNKTVGIDDPPQRDKSEPEQVESLLLHTMTELRALGITSYEEFERRLLENIKISIPEQGVTVSLKNIFNQEILSATITLHISTENVLSSASLSKRVGISFNPKMPLSELSHYFTLQDNDLTEDQVNAEITTFNSTYKITFSLDGKNVGQINLKSYEKNGKLVPAFVFNYYNGASCFIN